MRVAVALACAALTVVVVGGAPATVRAAPPDLQLVADTTFEPRPDDGLVHVSAAVVATANKPPEGNVHFFATGARLALLPIATNVIATSGGAELAVSEYSRDAEALIIDVTFSAEVGYQQQYRFDVAFDLPANDADPPLRVRVNPHVAAFPVWGIGTPETPGGSVTLALPEGFLATARPEAVPDGNTWSSLDDPLALFTYVEAARRVGPDDFTLTEFSVAVADQHIAVTLRGWTIDPEWAERTRTGVEKGLPRLAELIGMPYPGETLMVEEMVPQTLNGYAGEFLDVADRIGVAYDADADVLLHEMAHAWLNSDLARERWITEGFASYYAIEAADVLDAEGTQIELDDEIREHRFPLADWTGALGNDDVREAYGYAGSLEVAKLIAERAGHDGLTNVWRSADGREGAYQPLDTSEGTERWIGVPIDWRAVLDLLERHTDATYDDLWREWVVDEAGAAELDTRADARAAYTEALEHAGPWELPREARRAMAAWDFDDARAALAETERILDMRDAVAGGATNPIAAIGELGSNRARLIDEARAALADDRFEVASERLAEAEAARGGTFTLGLVRLGIGLALLVALAVVIWWRRRSNAGRLVRSPDPG